MSERPQYGDRIEVRDGDVWVPAVHYGSDDYPRKGEFCAFSKATEAFYYPRYDREGTTWRRAE